jgi:hypothetical protein
MAASALRVLIDHAFAAEVKAEFDAQDWSAASDPIVA